ncbi:extradiol dioxygenase [Mycolicibacterium moriokaense]|jgi:catechol 2,3-dioxygenase-like lactoylglutathione lyase family enzyme|uniref:Glyoxalase n=1 Tax=Mycolicibacterium moriokaense TaxID=39691 RepID=A0AAD1H6S5_9MYCO|nr:VOC family protein [Mycolicibacterium moriokaense]MCV7039031.1 VOC family protein [Mycolicibacterium moriokaense]ORB20377.1 extradiol dioxygenase [Mycolicibacterium moriokaense]BBW99931.1 glyoxalase [Mycolicibacterium moriokaense]
MNVSHIGLRVRDLDASLKFYAALGFTEVKRLTVPDQMAQGLLGLAPPIGFEAVYLRNDGVILQLLTFSGYPAPDEPERGMVGAGLTHLSIAVPDLPAAQAAVTDAGGSVVADPGGGFAAMVRDPDGQLIELVNEKVRPIPV